MEGGREVQSALQKKDVACSMLCAHSSDSESEESVVESPASDSV